jgi:hypothetical protein
MQSAPEDVQGAPIGGRALLGQSEMKLGTNAPSDLLKNGQFIICAIV